MNLSIERAFIRESSSIIYERYSFEKDISRKELLQLDISRTLSFISFFKKYEGLEINEGEEQLWDAFPKFFFSLDIYKEALEDFKEEYRRDILNQSAFTTRMKWHSRMEKRMIINSVKKEENLTIKKRRI